MSHRITGDRNDTLALIAKGDTHALERRADHIEKVVDDWALLFNWPALFKSFRADVKMLRRAARAAHARR